MQYLFKHQTVLSRDHEVILGVLSHRGIASSQQLQEATGKSQATVSRLLAGLSGQLLTFGRARATRYALPRPIRGLAAQQPVFWTDADGVISEIGTLCHLAGEQVYVSDTAHFPAGPTRELPWALSPLRAQGFLGRLHAQRLEGAGLDGDPDRWSLESTLYAALFLHDASGAITLGHASATRPRHPPMARAGKALRADLDAMALDVARTLPAGSSAGGEQPKFLAVLQGDRSAPGDVQHVIVKFTPPHDTPFGQRWRDLLLAEHLASEILARHGIAAARTRIESTPTRTYLISERFDRFGAHGRRHAVAIGEVHRAFVPDSYANWVATSAALARQGRLPQADHQTVTTLLAFGRLIGNTDMHSGNLALFVALPDLLKGRFTLAPAYDMLPMRWRPNASLGGNPDYAPFEPDHASLSSPAVAPAQVWWSALADHPDISPALRRVAAEMARRVAPTLRPGRPAREPRAGNAPEPTNR